MATALQRPKDAVLAASVRSVVAVWDLPDSAPEAARPISGITPKKGHFPAGVPAAVRLAMEKRWGELEARDDKNGDTAFLVACLEGCVECKQLLADAGGRAP